MTKKCKSGAGQVVYLVANSSAMWQRQKRVDTAHGLRRREWPLNPEIDEALVGANHRSTEAAIDSRQGSDQRPPD